MPTNDTIFILFLGCLTKWLKTTVIIVLYKEQYIGKYRSLIQRLHIVKYQKIWLAIPAHLAS